MTSSEVVVLNPQELPEVSVQSLKQDAAQKTSDLLTENTRKHHIFFNESGFHNHIVHHLLTVYALGASPPTLEKQYKINAAYQRGKQQADESTVEKLRDRAKWDQYLGKEKYYSSFLVFFQQEINEKGWEEVLKQCLFSQTEHSDDLLVRMFGGFLHPLIHLGFGIEFKQPAIIAEALAQGAVHDNWMGSLLLAIEGQRPKVDSHTQQKSIAQLLDEIHTDRALSTAAEWDDGNKIRDGILKRAPEKMIHYAAQFRADPSQLGTEVAEMINAVSYYTGAAQRPSKQVKFDFYFMHCVNSAIFFPTFVAQNWLSAAAKARLLEWKVWTDLAMYASRRSPDLLIEEIQSYKPKKPSESWDEIFARATVLEDDGHASKLVRALACGEAVSKPYEQRESFKLKKDMWLQLGRMVMDSVEGTDERWVRSAGFEEAWENFGPRAQL